MKRRGRLSLREMLEASHRARSYYAASSDKPAPPLPERLVKMGTKRTYKPSGKPLERDILKEVMRDLRADPRVARVDRNQSGVFQEGNRHIRVGSRGKLDLTVYLRDGRFVEIEVKRAPQVGLLSEAQRERIRSIKAEGGIAGWCWNSASAIALLPC